MGTHVVPFQAFGARRLFATVSGRIAERKCLKSFEIFNKLVQMVGDKVSDSERIGNVERDL